MIEQSFANVLRYLRNEQGLTQEDFSFKAGLHRTYVSQLERGLKSPSLKTIQKIARVLDISLTDFVSLVEQNYNLHVGYE